MDKNQADYYMNETSKIIPRIIWVLWFQGISDAPFLIKKCIESWLQLNPDWDVIVLDQDNLGKYIALDLPDKVLEKLSFAHKSDLVRLQLLSQYGGVWVDATTFCMLPLSEWIEEFILSGFFSFYKPGRDRLISNWFIVSEKGSPIIINLLEQLKSFWINNNFDISTRSRKLIIRLLKKIFSRSPKTTKYWFSPIITNIIKVHPYFVFHYMFERVVSKNSDCRAIWENTRKVSANASHRILRLGFFSPVTDEIKREIDEKRVPIYKLTYKYDQERYSPSTLLYYLLEERHKDM
jgi:hypothetical protein